MKYINKMDISFINLSQPDNKKLKRFADICLYTLPEVAIAILASPLPEGFKLWANTIITVIVVGFKAITKFTADVPVEVVPITEESNKVQVAAIVEK
jgi:hypothetical protein